MTDPAELARLIVQLGQALAVLGQGPQALSPGQWQEGLRHVVEHLNHGMGVGLRATFDETSNRVVITQAGGRAVFEIQLAARWHDPRDQWGPGPARSDW
jgi:hypothetical protein